jgi:hypothetical protein
MTNAVHPALRLRMQLISGAMLASVVLMLSFGYMLHPEDGSGVVLVSSVASAFAAISPLEVALVEKFRRPTGNPVADHIVPYALFEGAALFCGVALMVGPSELPLLAAAVPIGAMILRFPRGA